MVAIAAMNLHAFVAHVVQHFAGEDFHVGALGGKLLDGFHHRPGGVRHVPMEILEVGLDQARHPIAHGLRRERANGHFRQFVLDHAEIGDRLAERFPFLGVLQADLQQTLAPAQRTRPQLQPPQIQNVEGNDVPAAHLAQQIFHGYFDAV